MMVRNDKYEINSSSVRCSRSTIVSENQARNRRCRCSIRTSMSTCKSMCYRNIIRWKIEYTHDVNSVKPFQDSSVKHDQALVVTVLLTLKVSCEEMP